MAMSRASTGTVSSKILDAMRARAARVSLGPSSMRGAGRAGVVKAGRPYLADMDLRDFGVARADAFRRALDHHTDGLMRSFPRSARQWGLARKGLNIFLRECVYTVYLRERYRLDRAEEFFELPLDALTGSALHSAANGRLPEWRTVRDLDRNTSDQYQAIASEVAKQMGVCRMHLDATWWGQRLD